MITSILTGGYAICDCNKKVAEDVCSKFYVIYIIKMAGAFKRLAGKLRRQGHSAKSANAIAASIGRKKYGKKVFQKMAAKGRRRK